MVSNEDVTGFTIETGVRLLTFLILGLLTSEGKVNAKALVGDGGFACGVMAGRLLTKFGSKANGTLVKHRIKMLELGNTINVMMGIVQIFVAGMAKLLVPEKTFSVSSKAMGDESRVHGGRRAKFCQRA